VKCFDGEFDRLEELPRRRCPCCLDPLETDIEWVVALTRTLRRPPLLHQDGPALGDLSVQLKQLLLEFNKLTEDYRMRDWSSSCAFAC
jgi:hypothetical protein